MRWRGDSRTAGQTGCTILFFVVAALAAGDEPRLNQLQVIASHNSYLIAPEGAIRELLASRNAQPAQALDYTHAPSAEQFSKSSIRQVELDLYADLKGGLFARPAAPLRSEKMRSIQSTAKFCRYSKRTRY
jgi:hypothetical protein